MTPKNFKRAAVVHIEAAANWKDGLRRFNSGAIVPQLANVIHALKHAPEFAGVVAFDEFALRTMAREPAPWHSSGGRVWTDTDDIKFAEWCQLQGINVSIGIAGSAIQAVAAENSFHPLRDWLEQLEWDGVKRLDDWTTPYLGADSTPFSHAIGAKFLISAAARVLRPGAKADCILVLEGPQGTLKSSAARALFEPYFCDHLPDLGSKDAFLQLSGVWGVEISELAALNRAAVEKVKAFLSSPSDRFRAPYGTRPMDVPRQCVFIGTTNSDTYLQDETGGRRIWPIRCGKIDLQALRRDRDQLIAEAVAQFRAGASWWIDGGALNLAAEDEQEKRLSVDGWHEIIQRWIANPEQRFQDGHPIEPFTSRPDSVSTQDLLVHAIGKRPDSWSQIDANRVARTMRALKWLKVRRREAGALVLRFVPGVQGLEDIQ